MLADEIIDRLMRIGGGGITTDESRWDWDYLYTQLNVQSRNLLISWFNGSRQQAANRSIPNQYLQSYICEYEPALQDDDCVVKFRVPQTIIINGTTDGIVYVGTTTRSCNFHRIRKRTALSDFKNNRVTANMIEKGLKTFVLFDNTNIDNDMMIAEVYGAPMLKELLVEMVQKNPSDNPLFNRAYHDYPMSDNHISMMEDMITRGLLSMKSQPIDDTPNFSERQQQ